MHFLKLTRLKGTTVYINVDHIDFFDPAEAGTTLDMGHVYITVKQTPEQITEALASYGAQIVEPA